MHFDFHNYTSWTCLPVYSSEEILKNFPRTFGLFTGKVTINYLNLLLVEAFLKLLSYVSCGSSIGSENYGTFSLWFKGYLCYRTIFCHKVALDVQLMNFFIWSKNNVLLSRYLDFFVFVKSTDFKICDVIISIAG